ncbi:MAG: casein kinase substrate phosphoprotein PP28-domain-containing protein, partial [Olpidium bornovanus]
MAIGKFKHKRGGGRSFSSRCDDVEGADPFKGRKSPSSESASDSDSDSAESDGSDSDDVKNKPRFADNKAFGNTEEPSAGAATDAKVQTIVDSENPNRVKKVAFKTPTLSSAPQQLSRREREAVEKEAAKARYWELHKAGKTDEAKSDLARLAEVRRQREEAK